MDAPLGAMLLIALNGAGQAGTLRSQIENYDGNLTQATLKKDVATVAKLIRRSVTSDFVYVQNGLPMKVDQMIDKFRIDIEALQKVTSASAKLLTLRLGSGMAIATVNYKMTGIAFGSDKKPHTMGSSGFSTETYVKLGSRWKTEKVVWGNERITFDGQRLKSAEPLKYVIGSDK